MDNRQIKTVMYVVVTLAASIWTMFAVIDQVHAQNTKKADGLNFQVPEDWPIEKRGGIVAPIPTEEYVTKKFKETQEEFHSIKDNLSQKFGELQSSLKALESKISNAVDKGGPAELPPAQANEDLAIILENMKTINNEIGRLDRKITNKAMEISSQYESLVQQINTFETKIKDLQASLYKLDEEINYLFEKQGISY